MREAVAQVVEPATEVVNQEVELTPAQARIKAAKLRKTNIARKKQQNGYKRMIEQYTANYKDSLAQIQRQLDLIEQQVGKADFNMLKDICTNITPAKLNEAGEIETPEKKEVNKAALIREGLNLIVLKREERIKAGLRKRSTGRSSDRKAHRSAVTFLNNRNEEAKKEA
jgi:hypothetical protein